MYSDGGGCFPSLLKQVSHIRCHAFKWSFIGTRMDRIYRLTRFLPFLYHSDVNNCLNGGVTAWEENRIIPQRNHSYRYLRLALSESPETILTFPESLHFSISNPFLKYLLLITDPTVSQTPIPQASIHSLITPNSPPFPSPPAHIFNPIPPLHLPSITTDRFPRYTPIHHKKNTLSIGVSLFVVSVVQRKKHSSSCRLLSIPPVSTVQILFVISTMR